MRLEKFLGLCQALVGKLESCLVPCAAILTNLVALADLTILDLTIVEPAVPLSDSRFCPLVDRF